MNLLFIGDVFGRPGRGFLKALLPELIEKYQVDFTMANGENAAGGAGLTGAVAEELFSIGVDVITSGNHIWDKKEIFEVIEAEHRILRPANYPPDVPGKGSGIYTAKDGTLVGVVNVCGRVFSPQSLDCPFRTLDDQPFKVKRSLPPLWL